MKLIGIALAITVELSRAQTGAGARLKFDVASVRACGDASADRKTGDTFHRDNGTGGGGSSSPGTLHLGCWTVKDLIESAYLRYANGQEHSFISQASTVVEGGTAIECNQQVGVSQRFGGIGCWINSDRFTIDARFDGTPSQEIMRGPMMQALLEDKFKLKIHLETREVPVYELTVGDRSPKLQPARKGNCTLVAGTTGFVIPTDEMSCAMQTATRGIVTVEAQAMSLGEFSKLLCLNPTAARLGRPVIDKTGITGLFYFHLEYLRPDVLMTPSIFTAVQQQLGLRLQPAMGPREFLVIDRVERPAEH
jgi:uncharacterized protein (TIGR03435 family)